MLFRGLETERLQLKNISSDDREFLFKHFSNDEVNRFLFDSEPLVEINGADEIIEFYIQFEIHLHHRWILIKKDDGVKIGTCGFHNWNKEVGSCDIGYDLNPDYWGKGYMSETLHTIIPFARDEMKVSRINACIYPDNQRSTALVEKFGFIFTGETKDEIFRGGKYEHRIYFWTNNITHNDLN